jgi:hypothetical protein
MEGDEHDRKTAELAERESAMSPWVFPHADGPQSSDTVPGRQ